MRTLTIAVICAVAQLAIAQTTVNKSIPVQANQKISFRFDYPELIRITTWDKNEISIQGTVSINAGENDDAFILDASTSGNVVLITSEIKNLKNLPHRITIMNEGKKTTFKNKAEWNKHKADYHDKNNWMSEGVDMDITLEIKVPKNIETRLESVYGMVEVKEFLGPITVEATYGGVDASLVEKNVGELNAETDYGQIYSNLDSKYSNGKMDDFHTEVLIKPGVGARYRFESKYGNVYLRKQMN